MNRIKRWRTTVSGRLVIDGVHQEDVTARELCRMMRRCPVCGGDFNDHAYAHFAVTVLNDQQKRRAMTFIEACEEARWEEARRFHYLRPRDNITMNRERLVADAKSDVLEMARDYHQGRPRSDIRVAGESGRAIMMLGIHMGLRGGYMSEHDALVGRKLAHILSGGNLTGTPLVSEQYLLDLEREAFLSLLGQKKTQERMAYTLKTGKPLRN